MRNTNAFSLTRIFLTAGLLACILPAPCRAQKAAPPAKPADESRAATVSLADASGLLNRIKALESPTSRVYLYWRVAAWLSQNAGEDGEVRRAAFEAAAAGVSDLHRYEGEIPPSPASMLYARLLAAASKLDPQKAEELKRAFPLRLGAEATEEGKAAESFYSATSKIDRPEAAAEGARAATSLIESGAVRESVVLGELLRLDKLKSPALPQLLASTLALEERRPGALTPKSLFFLTGVYLKEEVPAPLQVRFLAASLKATRLDPAALKADPQAAGWVVSLLERVRPFMQKLTPDLLAEASARLAGLTPAPSPEAAIYERVKNSTDPLAQLMTEADSAGDDRLKGNLLLSAALEARKQGKLRLAAELMASSEDDLRKPPESHTYRDEFLNGVLKDALAAGDPETALFAVSKVKSPVERAGSLRLLARHQLKSNDVQSAHRTLGEARKELEGAAEGRESAAAYLQLAADFAELDGVRASEAAREAAKIAGRLKPLRDTTEGEFSWKLFPLADATVRAFQSLGRADRAGALSLANNMQPRELAVAAILGVYSSTAK